MDDIEKAWHVGNSVDYEPRDWKKKQDADNDQAWREEIISVEAEILREEQARLEAQPLTERRKKLEEYAQRHSEQAKRVEQTRAVGKSLQ